MCHLPFVFSFETASLTDCKFNKYARLPCQRASGILLSTPPSTGVMIMFHQAQNFICGFTYNHKFIWQAQISPQPYSGYIFKWYGWSLQDLQQAGKQYTKRQD